jgi:hypothetical protein
LATALAKEQELATALELEMASEPALVSDLAQV